MAGPPSRNTRAMGRALGRQDRRALELARHAEKHAPGKSIDMMKKGGKVKSSASRRADGVAMKGKTRGKMV